MSLTRPTLMILSLLAAIASADVARAQSTSFRGLGFLPNTSSNASYATGVNATAASANGAVVVGYANSGASGTQAYRWTGGVMTGLGYLGGDTSLAYAVSGDGATIVGHATGATTSNYAFGWHSPPMFAIDDSACGGTGPHAYGLSTDGTVSVGTIDTDHTPLSCFPGRAVRWINNSTLAFLEGGPSPPSGLARGANRDGSVIVGHKAIAIPMSNCNPCRQAFRWNNGVVITLGDFGGAYSSGYATNADGSVVVGEAAVDNVSSQPFRWTQADGLVGLGGTSINAVALAVNARGNIVVGMAQGKAFRWSATTGMQFVQDLLVAAGVDMTDWNLKQATGISADGSVIVGNAGHGIYDEAWIARLAPPEDVLLVDGFE